MAPPRLLLDTNILIASAYASSSASRWIVDGCLEGRFQAVMTLAVQREYERIGHAALKRPEQLARLSELLDSARLVEPVPTRRVVPDDPDDDKFVAAALSGSVDVLISNDQHLLDLDGFESIRVLRPGRFRDEWEEED
ncbi:hypothetical protein Pan216_23260 [Planctomycetes bacterium Pan216]|uniref:PIN domain-containing protein n=1 Tax=Kolteria novifilia TaxID=2527975 RepID=A0A518B3G4_9BACT|nr:hypothetical protein Pan216_23260 [Planctomycetes bacterium Pan216]